MPKRMRRNASMLTIEAMSSQTLSKAEDSIARLATISKEPTVCVEAIKALVSIAARPVSINGCTFKGGD